MGTIAAIEATAARFLTAAFGIDYMESSPHIPTDASSISIAAEDSDRLPARKLESAPPSGDAAEWMPLCDGTDSALALSMLHVLWNELGVYDEAFLKHTTNAPYLVGDDGNYLRDELTQLQLVLDASDRRIKTPDDPTLSDPSIIWTCEVKGRQGRPAFELLRERLSQYAPEIMEPLTQIPAATVRRIAIEFSTAASADSPCSLFHADPMPHRDSLA
jgi:anaerobic selenocysteine-containing dehydrogenase